MSAEMIRGYKKANILVLLFGLRTHDRLASVVVRKCDESLGVGRVADVNLVSQHPALLRVVSESSDAVNLSRLPQIDLKNKSYIFIRIPLLNMYMYRVHVRVPVQDPKFSFKK